MKRRVRPQRQQRDVAVVAAAAVVRFLEVRIRRARAQRLANRTAPRCGRPCGWNAARGSGRCRLGNERRDWSLPSQSARSPVFGSSARKSRLRNAPAVASGRLEWQRAQVSANTIAAARHRAGAELLLQVGGQVVGRIAGAGVAGLERVLARDLQIGGIGFPGMQEVGDVVEPILDRAEVGAIATALADVERRLPEIAPLRIELAQVGEVVDPALLRARADVEVHALDRFVGADRVLAALEDVVHAFPSRRPCASICRRARARTSRRVRCPCRRSTLRHLFTISPAKVGRCARLMIALIVPGLLIWSLGIADVSLVPGRACAKTWYSSESCRHARGQNFGNAQVLVADRALDVVPRPDWRDPSAD